MQWTHPSLGAQSVDGSPSAEGSAETSSDHEESIPAEGAVDSPVTDEPAELPPRLLDRDPFDRITLDAANNNAVIETVLLDLPERRVPHPKPTDGALEIRRLSHPSIPYAVDWAAIEKIELFEHMLLAEGVRLTNANDFAEAFEYFAFLSANYPQLEGLEAARQSHLWREASTAYAAGNRDEAWPALHALYLRNPEYPWLANAMQAVSDDLIKAHLDEQDYAAARTLVDMLEKSFPKLELPNIQRWRQQFQADAEGQLASAREAMAAERFSAARAAIEHARAILPTVAGGEELWRQIQTTAPEIRVAVTQTGGPASLAHTPTWATVRITELVDPRLVSMVDFGAEGGIYASPWAELLTSDDGLQTTVRLSPAGIRGGLSPDVLALRLVELATEGHPHRQEDFAALAQSVRIADGRDVQVAWRHPHVRPEALLHLPLRSIAGAAPQSGFWFDPVEEGNPRKERRYQRSAAASGEAASPRFIVEQVFPDDEAALDALLRGDVDAIDRVPPWQLERIQRADGIAVAPYRLPTVHVLIPNLQNPLLEIREFRRAIAYGIDAEGIVRDILLGGQPQPGFRTISGPFPAGTTLSDPAGYAYNNELEPRPYEPRLAALLAGVARTTLAKRDAALKKTQKAAAQKDGDDQDEQPAQAEESNESAGASAEQEADLPPPQPLILAHPADPIARLACQTIKMQLDQVGIPIKLAEFPGAAPAADAKHDLLYAELAVWEPIVDARRLLGPEGVAGRASPLMTMALDQLSRSENWNQARTRLNEIHRIAYYDLSLVPLWQTVNKFAYRETVDGVGASPVTLYQNIAAWRKKLQ